MYKLTVSNYLIFIGAKFFDFEKKLIHYKISVYSVHFYVSHRFALNPNLFTGSQRDKYKVPSFQIKEDSTVNLDVTAAGATLALGLMYFGTGNKAIADWMAPPETGYLLDFVRPDFLMLRVLSSGI